MKLRMTKRSYYKPLRYVNYKFKSEVKLHNDFIYGDSCVGVKIIKEDTPPHK